MWKPGVFKVFPFYFIILDLSIKFRRFSRFPLLSALLFFALMEVKEASLDIFKQDFRSGISLVPDKIFALEKRLDTSQISIHAFHLSPAKFSTAKIRKTN